MPEDLAETARRVGRQLIALADELAEAARDDAEPGPGTPGDLWPAAAADDQPA